MGRTTLKISFLVVAACTVILSFVVMGEMTMRWLKPADGNQRRLLVVASRDLYVARPPERPPSDSTAAKPAAAWEPSPSAKRKGVSLSSVAPPTRAKGSDALPTQSSGPFDAVSGQSVLPPAHSDSLAYADPAPASAVPLDQLPSAGTASRPADTAPAPVPAEQLASLPAGENPQPAPSAVTDASLGTAGGPPRPSRTATFKTALNETDAPARTGQSLRILQIGDSHTAADFFTGEVRQRLQAIYGDGGAGYLVVGKPNPGVRSEILKMTVSPGWAYSAIQKSDDSSQFHLSGFNAIAGKPGETLTLSTDSPISFDSIDIEVKHGPDSGAVELKFDNDQAVRFDLAGPKPEWWFLRATSQRDHIEHLRQLSIKTLDAKPVDISSVAIFNRAYGVSYSAVGFPGATIDIVNRFPDEFFTEDLQRIDPQIVVLAFGTNEGFNDALDIPKYGERYQQAINRIRAAVPHAEIVLVGPANSNRIPRGCHDVAQAMCKVRSSTSQASDQACVWETPPKLDRVREMQKLIARQDHIHFWDWSEIMPPDCGAQQWANATPHLMQPDHVHFTAEGYRIGADKFADFLLPIIEKLRLNDRVVSNN